MSTQFKGSGDGAVFSALEQTLQRLKLPQVFFWATHNGAEIDLILVKDGKRYGVECKRTDAPKLTPSMRTSLEELKLSRISVIYPGSVPYPLADRIQAIPLRSVCLGMKGVFPVW